MENSVITIYTDGSCNTQSLVGGWAAIILTESDKFILKGIEKNTTHNRMEIIAVIKAIEYSTNKFPGTPLKIFTDSQYVVNLSDRKAKLLEAQFITKKGSPLNNKDLLEKLLYLLDTYKITFIKVKAHQKHTGIVNLNREADKISRQVMRDAT